VNNWNSQSAVPAGDDVREHLERILASRVFARSDRLSRFLRFSVERALRGQRDQLKEQLIGIEVFDRKTDYDPRIDPIVRVEARRLRSKLKAYYTSPGRGDSVVIDVPKGTYAAVFRSRKPASPGRRVAREPQANEQQSIVVLPFANLTPDAGDDYFSDGLTEELIHLLTRIPRLRIVAWNTAAQLRGQEENLSGIRKRLNVATVLRGSVRRTPSRVRVTAQLIHAESGDYLWSEAYDRQMEDVFAIQEEMARAIVDALQLTLSSGGVRKGENLACYQLCLQGRFLANKRTVDGLRRSVTCFEQAIVADPCAAAYAGLADAYSLLVDYSLADPSEAVPKARAAAEKALALDPQSSAANVALAFIRSLFDWDWAGGEALYRRAIALNPGYSQARHWFGLDLLALLGRFDEALVEMEMARHLDPFSLIIGEGCGYVHMLRRDYPAALREYKKLVDLDPGFYKGWSSMGRVFCFMGRYKEAIAALEKARALGGNIPSTLSGLAHTLALAGRRVEAKAILDELHAMTGSNSLRYAIVHLGLGDGSAALDCLEAACERREMGVTALNVHPVYDPLRREPRFEKLLRRIKLLP
jgi:TolB-like protein/tetratricopeptide (TPR) repeat protein